MGILLLEGLLINGGVPNNGRLTNIGGPSHRSGTLLNGGPTNIGLPNNDWATLYKWCHL